jgi:hypothetical protein
MPNARRAGHDPSPFPRIDPAADARAPTRDMTRPGSSDLRQACVTPHVAQKSRYSAIDGRTTRHEGYALSQKHRKKIEEAVRLGENRRRHGTDHVSRRRARRSRFILTMAANNLARLPRLLAA